MEVETLEIPQQEIKTELENLRKGIEDGFITRKQTMTKDLLSIYGHLQHGGKIIDIPKTFAKTGLRVDDLPKLGIVPVNAKYCHLYKKSNGGAIFSIEDKRTWETYARKNDVELPPDTFNWTDLENSRWVTLAPVIPPRIHVEIACRIIPENYHILYEVEVWNKSNPPKDPILGRMLTKNLFGIIATWDLTDLERKIIQGRI